MPDYPELEGNNEFNKGYFMWANVTIKIEVTPTGSNLYAKSATATEFVKLNETDLTSNATQLAAYQEIMNSANAIVIERLADGNAAYYLDNIAVWGGTGEMPTNN